MKKLLLILLSLSCLTFFGCMQEEQEETPLEPVTSFSFEKEYMRIGKGVSTAVKVNIEPASRINSVTVSYSLSNENGIIELSEKTNSGVILNALKGGSSVVIAKCEGFTSYLEVDVFSDILADNPFISFNEPVYELKKGDKKTFQVSLSGGEISDNALFEWSVSDDNVCHIDTADNACIITALNKGFTYIEVKHPKTEHSAKIMVFVNEPEENPVYITTAKPIFVIGNKSGTQHFYVNLVNSKVNNNSLFSYEITEGNDVIDIIANNNAISVTPKKTGSAVIKITHDESRVPLEVRCFVVNEGCPLYIDSDEYFIEMTRGDSSRVHLSIEGEDGSTVKDVNYNIEVTDPSVIEVTNIQDFLYIKSKKSGSSFINITSNLTENTHEIFVSVNEKDNVLYYISAPETLIKCEVGDNNVELNISLAGGNESDKNGFQWSVSDKNIIEVETSFGSVNYSRSAKVYDGPDYLNANAIIVPKNPGRAEINVIHPKSETECKITVLVYPKGTLKDVVAKVKGQSVIKVLKGNTYTLDLDLLSGNESTLNWTIDNNSIVNISANGKQCTFTGITSGNTTVKCTSGNTVVYCAPVFCGTQEELDNLSYIYVDQNVLNVKKGENSYVKIKSSGISVENSSCSISDNTVCNATITGDILIINGLKEGSSTIAVNTEGATNILILIVNVYDTVDILKPYFFTYESFFGVVIGESDIYTLNLSSTNQDDKKNILWSCQDESICSIDGNGESCVITGKSKGRTEIYAHSDKSEKDAKIIVYTAETRAELESMIILDCDKRNYLCKTGEEIFASVSVSDRLKNYSNIKWDCDDLSVIKIESNYENAVLKCIGEGDCLITVSCKTATPIYIYVSVRDEIDTSVPLISVNPYIEIDEEETVSVKANTSGLSDSDIQNLKWEIVDDNIGLIKSNGDSCIVKGLSEGYTDINITSREKNISVRICLIVYKKGSPHLPVLVCSNSLYEIEKGTFTNINITFASIKPSETQMSNIKFESDSEIIKINSNLNQCNVEGIEEGSCKITVSGDGFYNKLDIKINVFGKKDAKWQFDGTSIIKILTGNSIDYECKLKNTLTNEIVNCDSNLSYEIEDDNDLFTVLQSNNVLHITANKKGKAYIKLSHPQVADSLRILIYAADTQEELDNVFLMNPVKDHYLLRNGENATLELQVDTDDDNKIKKIKWSLDDSNICSYSSLSKTKMNIKGKKEGNAVFSVTHPDFEGSIKFYISVTDNNYQSRVSIVTPSIIIIPINKIIPADEENEIPEHDLSYSSQVVTSLSDSECNKFVWRSLDDSIASVSGNGKYFVVSGNKKGCTEIEVKYDNINYRRIVCRVIDDYELKDNIALLNIDERYKICPKGTSFCLTPYMAQKISDSTKNNFSILQDNGVIKIENRNGLLFVNCKEEGVSTVRVSNSECENSFDLYFEVHNIENVDADNLEKGSLNALQSLYTLDINDKTKGCVLNVSAVNIKEEYLQFVNWTSSDDSIVSIVPSGDYCTVYPKKIGSCDIKASSVYSYNDAVFRIVVCDKDEIKIPYIKTDKNTMRLKSGETGEFKFEIQNVNNYDVSKFNYTIKDEKICSVINEGNIATVKGISSGQTILTVDYEGLESINCVISVQGVIDNLVYLQSDNVYSVVQKGYSKKITVNLIGYDEVNQNNFKWDFKNEEDKSKLALSPSGSSIVVKGLEEGFVTLVCTHINPDPLKTALCPLEISVFIVSEDDIPIVYMKTDGIIQMKEGEKYTAKVELVGGHESELSLFDWKVATDSVNIIKIVPSQNQALITGLSSGVGRIILSHPSCLGLSPIEIVVVVNEDTDKESLQITTDSTLIEGKLSDSYKTVNVRLAGGSIEQQLLFTWEIVSFESIEKNNDGTSLPVISLVSQTGEQNIIKYLREGNATVRVKNTATSHYIDIKFIINEYSTLRFEETNVTLKEYESTTVNITSPTSKTVVYNSSDESIATVYGTNRICCIEGIKTGYAVITARTSDGLLSDQITVRVNKNTDSVPLYLNCNTSLVSLDTTDTNGYVLKGQILGTINGENINPSQNDLIKWNIKSNKNDILKIVGSNSKEAVGKEISILPVSAGEETIVLSHPQTQRTKEVYVKVSSPSFSLQMEDTYGVYEVGDIGNASCTLSGVPLSEENNIVWHTSDSSIVSLNTENGESDTVYGTNVVFRCKQLCEKGLPITVTYKDMIKTFTVFIKALPSLHLLTNNDLIRSGQTNYYNIICTPEDYIGDLNYTYSSSAYIITTTNGKMMTGLIRNESERLKAGDNPPEGIRPPYFKVTGGARQGMTSFSFECRSLTSVLNINTDNTVLFEITSYDEFDKNNRLVQHKDNPTVVEVRADSKYTRVYYNLEPEVNVDQLMPNQVIPNLINSFRLGNVKIINGKNTGTTGRYFDLYPDEKGCNWGDIKLTVTENNKVQNVGIIRVSFSMPDSDKKFSFTCQNGVPARFFYDTENGLVRGCGKGDNQLQGQKAQMNLVYSAPYCYGIYNSTTEIYVEVGNQNLFEESDNFYNSTVVPVNGNNNQTVYKIVRKSNPVLVTFEYPAGYGLTGKYSKYFIFYEELYK